MVLLFCLLYINTFTYLCIEQFVCSLTLHYNSDLGRVNVCQFCSNVVFGQLGSLHKKGHLIAHILYKLHLDM